MKFFVTISALLLFAAPAAQAATPSADSVVASHVLAMGGADAVAALRNVRIEVEIVEPSFTVVGDYRATDDGRMRIDVSSDGKRVFSEGLDAAGAWQQVGADAPVAASSDTGKAALQHGIEFNVHGLGSFAARGHKVDYVGRERVDGGDYDVLRVTLRDGFETQLYVNVDSHLIERQRDVRALHPDADPSKKAIENVYEDFVPLCGVMRPRRSQQIDLATGAVLQTTRTLAARCNAPAESLELDRPGTR